MLRTRSVAFQLERCLEMDDEMKTALALTFCFTTRYQRERPITADTGNYDSVSLSATDIASTLFTTLNLLIE